MKQVSLRLPCSAILALAAAALLASCGGGGAGGTGGMQSSPGGAGGTGASGAAVSSGTITAFGSVFVNGREFATSQALLIDDDTLASSADLSGLEVGMVADIKPAAASTSSSPVASELHVHPLARGIVDASDTTASTLTVMGQTVQLTAATSFSDHRACLSASTSPCTAITGQSGLGVTTGSGGSALAGNYVSVDGYLYGSGGANIVATLVSVHDAPTSGYGAAYKAEGTVSAVSGSTLTIGGLSVDLSSATCHASGARSPCASAFAVGQVVSAIAATAPPLPATGFTAQAALLRDRLPVETVGASVEVEGQVSSISGTSFAIRGFSVDASALPGSGLPVVGDDVRVQGTVAAGGSSIAASAITVVHAVATASYGFAGTLDSVSAGSAADTYVITVLGQSIAVSASTRLADLSVLGGHRGDSSGNPFNIGSFQTYLAASASQSLQVQTAADANGKLTALSVVIVPTSTVASVSGVVDAAPAPVNSSATGTPSTFAIHGVPVSADPSAIVSARYWRQGSGSSGSTIAAGDFVVVRGAAGAGGITVAAVSGHSFPALSGNVVIDSGVPPTRSDEGCF